MRSISALAVILLGITLSAAGQANSALAGYRGDVALTYQYTHSNTQPGDCGCFNLNGGGLSVSWQFRPHLSAVVEGDGGFAGSGPSSGSTLTLASGLGGIRYSLPFLSGRARAPQFFGEVLAGGAHAGGGIAGAADGTYAFIAHAGGGLDEPLSHHFALRFQASYAPSTFANGVNGHQNDLLAEAGVVYRWSHSRK
jgi:outer membrane immunogenic protein